MYALVIVVSIRNTLFIFTYNYVFTYDDDKKLTIQLQLLFPFYWKGPQYSRDSTWFLFFYPNIKQRILFVEQAFLIPNQMKGIIILKKFFAARPYIQSISPCPRAFPREKRPRIHFPHAFRLSSPKHSEYAFTLPHPSRFSGCDFFFTFLYIYYMYAHI